jgi:hypothetical protein
MARLEQAKQVFERVVDEVTPEEPKRAAQLVRAIEERTAKIPAISFMGLAVGSMILSATLEIFSKRKEYGNFVGLWAPSFLMMGIYNKLLQMESSNLGHHQDRVNPSENRVA